MIIHVVICIILLIFIIPVYAIADNNTTGPNTYVSYIDDKIGFFKVINTAGTKEPLYKDRVLTINQGDTVIWLNDADNATFTIVSEQNLWDKTKSKLGSTSRRFSYTFMIYGTYSVYIEEYDNIVAQKIIVNPVEGYPTPTPSATPIPTITATPTPITITTPTPKPTIEIILLKNISKETDSTIINMTNRSLINSSNSTSEEFDTGLSWNVVIGLINAISNLIISLSIFLIAYKIWKECSFKK